MQSVVIDTETTGLLFYEGHKIIEIACIEINNEILGKKFFHTYINPERNISKETKKITGLDDDFLRDKPIFKNIVNDFFKFLSTKKTLIMHNALFDINFINNELKLINHEITDIRNHFKIIDTLDLARKLHPGKKNNLDTLCKRYNIDLSSRTVHGALTDAKLLGNLYIEMINAQEKKNNMPNINFKKNNNIKKIKKINQLWKI